MKIDIQKLGKYQLKGVTNPEQMIQVCDETFRSGTAVRERFVPQGSSRVREGSSVSPASGTRGGVLGFWGFRRGWPIRRRSVIRYV
eukprot:6472364-Pyramimonas_sp.AAC.1